MTSHSRHASSYAIEPGSEELTLLTVSVVRRHNSGEPPRRVAPEHRGNEGAWKLMERTPPASLYFCSHDAAFMWIEFCLGQISDGKYERNRGGLDFWKLGVHVDPALIRSGLRYRQTSPWKRPFHVSFTDLLTLFDSADELTPEVPTPYATVPGSEEARTDVRRIFSRLDDRALKKLLEDLAHAANGGLPEASYKFQHADGRVCRLSNHAATLIIDIVDEDGDAFRRERPSSDLPAEQQALCDEMLADGFVMVASGPDAAK